MASGAMPTPPPTRIARRPSGGGAKPCPSGPSSHTPSPARSSHSRCVPGPTSSSRKCDSPPLRRAMEKARGRSGRSLLSPAPALGGGEHRELPGVGLGTVGVCHPQHAVGAQLLERGDRRQTAPKGCLAHATPARAERGACAVGCARAPWSSCRQSTSGSPSRCALAIARAAEMPAASVVRQGIPCATAARRIS